jgi:hypothetical protein
MYINLVVESITQSISFAGAGLVSSLTLLCSRSEGDGVLEIGKKHAFANKSERVAKGRTHFSEMRIAIRRKSALTDGRIDGLGLGEDKIGELGFYPPKEKSDDLPAYPATLEAYIFVSDHDFEGTLRSVGNGGSGATVSLYVVKGTSIVYGWEPDGSRVVWAIETASEPAYAPISEVKIELPLYKRSRQ